MVGYNTVQAMMQLYEMQERAIVCDLINQDLVHQRPSVPLADEGSTRPEGEELL